MGSLDSATSGVATNAADNTTQETTLATIRSVSGDWDNSAITFTSAAAGVSAFTSSGLFHAPASCASKGTVKIQIWGGGGSGALRANGLASGGRGGAYSMTLVHDITGTGHVMDVTIGSGAAVATLGNNAHGTKGGSSSVRDRTNFYNASGGPAGRWSASHGTNSDNQEYPGAWNSDTDWRYQGVGNVVQAYTGMAGTQYGWDDGSGLGGAALFGGTGGKVAGTYAGNNTVANDMRAGTFPGGGGAANYSGGGTVSSGAGGDGFVLIEW